MFIVGLTGGVGSGKSTVADLFATHGTYLIDADVVAREVVEPGNVGFSQVIGHFGDKFLNAEGAIDRAALGRYVFTNPDALTSLNAIVHPLVRQTISTELSRLQTTDRIVLLSVPLFVESGQYVCDRLVVVDIPEALAVTRLVKTRGWTAEEAHRRIAVQASRKQRLAAADYVIDNSGSLEDLKAAVDASWEWITSSL